MGYSKNLSSSGPGPSPISISKIKKRTRTDAIIQRHPPPPTAQQFFNVNIKVQGPTQITISNVKTQEGP